MKIEIDAETAELISLSCLRQHKKWVEQEIKGYKKQPNLSTTDLENLTNKIRTKDALKVVIDYFGGDIR